MIERLANGLIEQMTEEKMIDQDLKEHYIYAFITLTERFITVGSIILISFVVKMFIPTIFFLFFFFALRKRTGGYHFDKFYQCYLGTIIAYLVTVIINAFMINYPLFLMGVLLIAIVVIETIGTVNHPNMNMDIRELVESQKAARLVTLLEGSIIYCFVILGADMVVISYMAIAVILCAALLCIAKIIKQEV